MTRSVIYGRLQDGEPERLSAQAKALESVGAPVAAVMLERGSRIEDGVSDLPVRWTTGDFVRDAQRLFHETGAQRLLRVFAGARLGEDSLRRFVEFHEKEDCRVTIFQPTIGQSIRSRESLADIVDRGVLDRIPARVQGLAWLRRHLLDDIGRQWFIAHVLGKLKMRGRLIRSGLFQDVMFSSVVDTLRRGYGSSGFFRGALPADERVREMNGIRVGVWGGTTEDLRVCFIEQIDRFLPFPPVLNVVLSNRCNFECVMCPYFSPDDAAYPKVGGYFDDSKYMPVEMLRRVIQEAARWGAQLKFGQADEPLLYPKFAEMLREAKEAGVPRIHVTTNGSLLTGPMRDAMIRYVDRVQVSLDAATEETYRQIRLGRKAVFPVIVENVRSLIRERNRRMSSTPEIMPVMILQKPAIEERQQFMDMWLPLADGVIFNGLTVMSDGVDVTLNANFPMPEQRLICGDPWLAPFLLPDGEVIFCCESLEALPRMPVAQLTLGNIRDGRTVREVWLGEEYRRLREANLFFDWKKSPLCEKCSYWTNHYSRRSFENGLRVQQTHSVTAYFRE